MEERKKRLLEGEALWSYALKVLGGRAHSSGEMKEKLRRRAARPGEVDEVLTRLKDHGYLNDQRFAESFAASRLANDKFGKTRVIQDLRHRRVAPAVAERAARQVYEDVNEEKLIEDWLRRKYRLAPRDHLFEQDKDLAAAYRRLLHAGFRTGDIVRALKRFARNPELLDSFEPPEETGEE
ncbi:MAG TPA: RecX family transcriptional regulator [Bryobacteraceae bacterium]|nr:RecX family transcriptional regulator [Bryobacteraceae bacterium]